MGIEDCGNECSLNSTRLETLETSYYFGPVRLVLQEFLKEETTQDMLGKNKK